MIASLLVTIPAADGAVQIARQDERQLRFVTLLGRDTIAVEEARWRGDSLRGVILVQEPSLTRFEYQIRVSPRGGLLIAAITQSVLGSNAWQARRRVTLRAVGDSVRIGVEPEGTARTVHAPDAALSLPGSGALVWLAARRFDQLSVDSAALPWLAPLGGPGGRFIVRRRGVQALEYRLSGGFSILRRDSEANIVGIDARGTTLKIEVAAAASGVMERVLERWAGQPAGPLSPRDTVRARVGTADLWIDYGRPAVRGRDVFADGVLGDTVWRTGANAATQFETTVPLEFATGRLPAGRYTLFTRIRDEQSELIINGRVGIWGTQYSSASDALRVPMLRGSGPFSERLFIGVNSSATELVIRWADQTFRVPFRLADPAAGGPP